MKKVYLLLVLAFFTFGAFADSGIWAGGFTISVDGTSTNYRINGSGPGTTITTSFNFGSMNATTVTLSSPWLASWKADGCDVTGGKMTYRVYRATTTAPTFNEIVFGFGCNCSSSNLGCVSGGSMACTDGRDQIWNSSTTINLKSLAAQYDGQQGDYVLEVNYEISSSCGTRTASAPTRQFTALTVVPVNIYSFSATINNSRNVDILWLVGNETNSKGYSVERSSNGNDYAEIGFVASKGNGAVGMNQAYSFVDNKVLAGVNYYRLKQMDLNGKFAYSTVVTVKNYGWAQLSVYPNPAVNSINISTGNAKEEKFVITNAHGQTVKSGVVVNKKEIDISTLSKGVYFVSCAGQYVKVVKN